MRCKTKPRMIAIRTSQAVNLSTELGAGVAGCTTCSRSYAFFNPRLLLPTCEAQSDAR